MSHKKPTKMFMSRKIQNQNEKSRSQLMVSFDEENKQNKENIWQKSGYFNDLKVDLTLTKKNFPENTLFYINNGTISKIKDKNAFYLEYVALGQLMPLANPNPEINLDNYELKENECLLFVPLYNKANGFFRGIGKRLAHIMLRGDKNEVLFSYGYSEEMSKVLFCYQKTPIPNVINATAFTKHHNFLINEKNSESENSNLFLFLPSTIDRKEKIMQHRESVNLHPIDIEYNDFKEMNGGRNFNPYFVESPALRNEIKSVMYTFMKRIANISNNNLLNNANAYLASGGKIDPDYKFEWPNSSHDDLKTKFQMSY